MTLMSEHELEETLRQHTKLIADLTQKLAAERDRREFAEGECERLRQVSISDSKVYHTVLGLLRKETNRRVALESSAREHEEGHLCLRKYTDDHQFEDRKVALLEVHLGGATFFTVGQFVIENDNAKGFWRSASGGYLPTKSILAKYELYPPTELPTTKE